MKGSLINCLINFFAIHTYYLDYKTNTFNNTFIDTLQLIVQPILCFIFKQDVLYIIQHETDKPFCYNDLCPTLTGEMPFVHKLDL